MKTKRTRTKRKRKRKRTAPTNRRSCASRTKTRECTMERFVHNANIEHYRRLIAESEFDPSRDEGRHKMLLTHLNVSADECLFLRVASGAAWYLLKRSGRLGLKARRPRGR